MSYYKGGGGGGGGYDNGNGGDYQIRIPPRWLNCPRKSDGFIVDKFVVFKTPLSSKFNVTVPTANRFLPNMIMDFVKSQKLKIGLWIDLSNTSRYYTKDEIEKTGAHYVKLQCRGHGETPSPDTVAAFNRLCSDFLNKNETDLIGVHCTHGFNRSGFLICSFLVEEYDFSIATAFNLFAKHRPPGIYKQTYINQLWDNYPDPDYPEPPVAPPLPDWCYDDTDVVDDDGVGSVPGTSSSSRMPNGNGQTKRQHIRTDNDVSGSTEGTSQLPVNGIKRRRENFKDNPIFVEGVENVHPITNREELLFLQRKVQDMCGWESSGFPGSQPVSMDINNIAKISEKPYMVSWKADGTRYLMLIEKAGSIYFIDRDNCVFRVEGITFPSRKNFDEHLYQTLVDGEMVLDIVNGITVPRYLIYDIIKFRGEDTGKVDFRIRLTCIRDEIVNPRYKAIEAGLIDRATEPFGVRFKTFWFAEDAFRILEGKFTQELMHEPDGLIFQPTKDPYVCGRCDEVLKWKPPELNSIDFRLKVCTQTGEGLLPTKIGELYVGGLTTPFSIMRPISKMVQKYDGKIIECKYEDRKWVFMRERTDKSFPNAFTTAKAVAFSIQHPVTKDYLLEYIALKRWRKQP